MATSPQPLDYKVFKFQKFDGRKCSTKEHVVCLIDSLGSFACDPNFFLQGVLQTPGQQSIYLVRQPKPSTVHVREHLVSLLNANFFFTKGKFSLAELGICNKVREDLDTYVRDSMTKP